MSTHAKKPSPGPDDLVQLNVKVRREVREQLEEAKWSHRLSLQKLVEEILEAWLAEQGEKGTDGEQSGKGS